MTTLNGVTKLYDRLTPHERLLLVMGAFARGDEGEAERLVRTCPRFTYKTLDFDYMELYDAWVRKATEFALLWIEAAGRFARVETVIWGMTKMRERYIDGLNRGWQVAAMEGDFITPEAADAYFHDADTTKTMDRERRERVAELKGMMAGLHRFCVAAKVDEAHFMAAWTPLLESIEEHRPVLDDAAIPADEHVASQIDSLLRLRWPGVDAAEGGGDER
jgi:hypothetical protein